ncbi:ribosome recycling factor [Candidatus Peregrinibacteria bacterium]|nr:ribosome recycling factor [Candidatus Peregrinibacteria bacterium]
MPDQIILTAKTGMQKAIDHLHEQFMKLQTGRAHPGLVEGIMVESYGTMMPLKGLATISIPESKQIAIQPWSRDQLQAIERAIIASNLGFNPKNDGVVIRITLAPLTEERRKELVKIVHQYAEEARIAIRNLRHEAMNQLKEMEKAKDISEDVLSGMEKEMQKIVDDFNGKVEDAAKQKEKDVMTV